MERADFDGIKGRCVECDSPTYNHCAGCRLEETIFTPLCSQKNCRASHKKKYHEVIP